MSLLITAKDEEIKRLIHVFAHFFTAKNTDTRSVIRSVSEIIKQRENPVRITSYLLHIKSIPRVLFESRNQIRPKFRTLATKE